MEGKTEFYVVLALVLYKIIRAPKGLSPKEILAKQKFGLAPSGTNLICYVRPGGGLFL